MKMEKFAYIGCRTTKERKARGKGISVYKVDGDNWELVQILEGQGIVRTAPPRRG